MLDLGLLLAQLVLILAATRLAGRMVSKIGQPPVIGEMLAGIALGPSLFGAIAPETMGRIFPPDGMTPLAALSQLGVLLFLFVVGLRLDLGLLRSRARTAVAVSHTSMAVPFVMGAGIAPLLHPTLAPDGVALLPFALFLGAAMSVTAFPVLARILSDRKMMGTRVGSVAISSAAVDDVTAWCLLAAVVAVARATGGQSLVSTMSAVAVTVGATLVYTAALFLAGRPLIARVMERIGSDRGAAPANAEPHVIDTRIVSFAVIVALGSGWVTEKIGVHALFGAFLAGVIMPRVRAEEIASRIEDVVSSVMLPLFFAFTGLRTAIALVSGAQLWLWTALILVVAIVGKTAGSSIAARVTGMSWRDAGAVGVLMNTRGLMELVVLNVGLDIGVISPTLFAMMVIMALTTTVMTAPLLSLLRIPRGGDDPLPAGAAIVTAPGAR